jgi:hypothetical protein
MIKAKEVSIILLIVTILTTIVPFSAYAESKDYIGHWAGDIIQIWLDNGYITGYPDGSFRPDAPITRAEFVKLVNNLMGYTETATISFTDVNPDDWFYKDVQIAFKAGYIAGISETLFDPYSYLTREQAAVIVTKILGIEINSDNVQIFSDSNLISDWARDYVNAAALAQVLLGYSEDNTFRPQKPITRAEALVLLNRLNKFEIVDEVVPEGTITPPPTTGGGSGGGGGPVNPTPVIDISVKNLVVMIGIAEEFDLADNLIVNTSNVKVTYTISNNDGIVINPLNGIITGIKQGTVNVSINATKEGYTQKTLNFAVVVAPVKISWKGDIAPSGEKILGQEQTIEINMKLLENVQSVENVNLIMLLEKYVDTEWIAADDGDLTVLYESKEIQSSNGIYQLIKGMRVDSETTISTKVTFNEVGEYKLTVYCIKE